MARNVAVVLAGGVGARVGLTIPKQLIKIAGRTVLEHTLATLHAHPEVDEIIVMMARGYLDVVREIVRANRFSKVVQILEGAETRNGTTERALDAISEDDAKVLFHDAVRPLVSDRIITDCFRALDRYDAVDVAIPSADTIIEVGEDNTIRDVPPRATLRRGQTPQGFRAGTIRRAYAIATQDDGFTATDDCTVVLRYLPDTPIWVVAGEERNMKVTEPIDVHLVDKLFQLPSRTAHGSFAPPDANSLQGRTLVIFGGSYGIGAEIAALAGRYGAQVMSFSRSGTGTHVDRREDVAAAAAQALESLGHVDFVVNTAGVLPSGELRDTSEETVYSATEVNYLGPIFIAQEFYPLLRASGGGLLYFTSSSYTRGRAGYSLYSSAKAAVVNLTQALADEWSRDNVKVNCINPERTATPMRVQAFGSEPADSLLNASDVAHASLQTLASGETGQIVDVRLSDPLMAPPGEH